MKNAMYTNNSRIKMFVKFVFACICAIILATVPVFATNVTKACTFENRDGIGNETETVVSEVLPEVEIFTVTYEFSTFDEGENLGIMNEEYINTPQHSEQPSDVSGTVTIGEKTFTYETVQLDGRSFVKYTQVENQYGYLWMIGLLLVSATLIGILTYITIKDKKLLFNETEL